jgi:hypothetical protein
MDAFTDEPVNDPERFIELTSTRAPVNRGETGFTARCEQFLRQFPRLDGWPADVSLPA